jgi:hypothetical protein
MPWIADADVGAAHGFAWALVEARTVAEVRRWALAGLAELGPADVLTWDRVELATGAVRHEAIPAAAESPGAFEAVVCNAAGHPLLSAHAVRRRRALRLSDAVEPRRVHHNELYANLLHPSGVEYCITIVVRTERREMVVAGLGRTEREFSERDREVLDLVRPALEDALLDAEARKRSSPRWPPTRRRAPPSRCWTVTARSSFRAPTPSVGWPSTSGRPSIAAGCPGRSLGGWRCRRACRSSASATAGATPSVCCPAIRTRCCSRGRSRASAPPRSTALA